MNATKTITTRTKTAPMPIPQKKVLQTTTTTTTRAGTANRKNRKSSKSKKPASSMRKFFRDALLYPDAIGPVQFPVQGSSSRSVVGMDRTRIVISSSASATQNQAVVLSNNLIGGTTAFAYAGVSSENVVFGTGTTVLAGISYPNASQLNDTRMTACSLLISYTGNVLNAQGEILIGTVPSSDGVNASTVLTGASTSTISYYPGVIRVPIAKLIDSPLRVAGRHASPTSWEFVGSSALYNDWDLPFVVMSSLPNNQSVTIEIIRNFECRSNVSASMIPYASSEAGKASDDDALTNAMDDISNITSTVTEYLSSEVLNDVASLFGKTASSFGAVGIASQYMAYHYNMARNGRFRNSNGGGV